MISAELEAVAVAYHEAGHAVACEAAGYEVTSTTVGEFPECRYRAPTSDLDSPGGIRRLLVVTFAGMAAEARRFDRPDVAADDRILEELDDLDDDDCDLAHALRLVAHMPEAAQLAELLAALDDARGLIAKRWNRVEALAGSLAAAGRDAADLIDSKRLTRGEA